MPEITQQSIQFETEDGATLHGVLTAPDAPHRAMVISGATGVPPHFYKHFAEWLAEEQGFAVLTYSYRDMQDDSPRAMRRSNVTMQDWAITDGQAARDHMRGAFADLPLWVLGHSLGGMMVSKQPRLDGIDRLITIASGLVDHRAHPMPYRLSVMFFWFLAGPLSTGLMGYLPGKTIGLGSTLPARVFWQWRQWCTSGADAFLNDKSLPVSDWSRSGAPVRIVGITDDVICPVGCAFNLAKAYDGGAVDLMEITGEDHGLKALGHFGLFSRKARAVWPKIIA